MSATITDPKNLPIFRRRYGAVEVAVFEWPGEIERVSHTTKLTYSFKRKNSDVFETSEYLPTSELLAASKLLSDAHSAIVDRLEQQKRDRPA